MQITIIFDKNVNIQIDNQTPLRMTLKSSIELLQTMILPAFITIKWEVFSLDTAEKENKVLLARINKITNKLGIYQISHIEQTKDGWRNFHCFLYV
jgi:hypothetical protein